MRNKSKTLCSLLLIRFRISNICPKELKHLKWISFPDIVTIYKSK